MSWLEGSRARLRLLFNRRAAESRMTKEIAFHVDMEAERLVREQGLDAGEARRRALVAFGGMEKHKEQLRDGSGRAWFDGFALDLKLGGRMLVKYPGLTIVGGLAMAFAICVGTIIFQVLTLLTSPTLPLPAGDRIVEIHNWDFEKSDDEPPTLYDFVGLARHAAVGDGAWRLAQRHAQPDCRRRRCASRCDRGDHRVRLSRGRRHAAHGPRPGRRRRADRGATSRRDRLRGVAHALRQRS